eukprot:CAMPEP_0170566498 /NCGR_PEP_ID=MMETSP0211-20121228/79880_1 /TAXON_ID=311385 /ORGANISM="Pseudokeronopsis sp., Strain OXSARD2" /LENGTH=93 /DNA_ID=CAMNT_0010887693 /DNA_START=925 /DNA_END=1202 /DNA_ORIENTATION=+
MDLSGNTFKDIFLYGDSTDSNYWSSPYLIMPGIAMNCLFYENTEYSTDYDFEAADSINLSNTVLSNVTCENCANFLFFFAAKDFNFENIQATS